jgi:hypothetical protein
MTTTFSLSITVSLLDSGHAPFGYGRIGVASPLRLANPEALPSVRLGNVAANHFVMGQGGYCEF